MINLKQEELINEFVEYIQKKFPEVQLINVTPSPENPNDLWINVTYPEDSAAIYSPPPFPPPSPPFPPPSPFPPSPKLSPSEPPLLRALPVFVLPRLLSAKPAMATNTMIIIMVSIPHLLG
jgi:hypothetical protein